MYFLVPLFSGSFRPTGSFLSLFGPLGDRLTVCKSFGSILDNSGRVYSTDLLTLNLTVYMFTHDFIPITKFGTVNPLPNNVSFSIVYVEVILD